MDCYVTEQKQSSFFIPIIPILSIKFLDYLNTLNDFSRTWIKNLNFNADPGAFCILPAASGAIDQVLIGLANEEDFWQIGALAPKLPAGNYILEDRNKVFLDPGVFERAIFAWGSGSYRFQHYLTRKPYPAKLFLPEYINRPMMESLLSSIYFARDLINIPTEDMGPPELAQAVLHIAKPAHAKVKIISGEELKKQNFMAIYMVGRAGSKAAQLIDLTWGDSNAPKVTLIGKGVCFDTGGLDIKPADGMRDMKKDMGGAALAIALAQMIMSARLPIRLRLLIPAVENSVGSNSYRPGDVIKTRAGLSVEVSNTDAEGRLVLCDALAEAVSEKPDLILDFATLTGAARIALGPDVPVLFSNDETLANDLLMSGQIVQEPLWRLPLYQPYFKYLRSTVADMMNAANTRYAGCITAALFLQKFVPDMIPWAHFDIFSQNLEEMPGRPLGGEVFPLRSIFHYLSTRFL